MNRIILFLDDSLFRNTIDVCILILYPITLLIVFFFLITVDKNSFSSSFSIWMLFIYLCLIALDRMLNISSIQYNIA